MQMCEHLLLEYPEKLNGKAGPIHRALLLCITLSSNKTRRKCFIILQNLIKGLNGTAIARAILKDLIDFLENTKIQVRKLKICCFF